MVRKQQGRGYGKGMGGGVMVRGQGGSYGKGTGEGLW